MINLGNFSSLFACRGIPDPGWVDADLTPAGGGGLLDKKPVLDAIIKAFGTAEGLKEQLAPRASLNLRAKTLRSFFSKDSSEQCSILPDTDFGVKAQQDKGSLAGPSKRLRLHPSC